MKAFLLAAAVLAAGSLAPGLLSQQDFSLDAPKPVKHQNISYVAEQQVVPAGKRAVLQLHFQVEAGYHVNSHTPKSDLQIATVVELAPAAGVKLAAAEYPKGAEFTFAFDPTEKLDVYQDGFVVRIPVTAVTGEHELKGTLHYQACTHAACYPPKALPIVVPFTAK